MPSHVAAELDVTGGLPVVEGSPAGPRFVADAVKSFD
jgi:hypothetical protein